MTGSNDIELAAIEDVVRRLGGVDPAEALALERLSGGRSQMTIRVSVGADDPTEARRVLVVKYAGPDGPLAPYDVEHEARMIELAGELGVPAPPLIGTEASPDGNGGFLVMGYVAGEAPGLREIAGWLHERGEGARANMITSIVDVLGAARGRSGKLPLSARDLATTYTSYIGQTVERLRSAADPIGFAVPRSVFAAAEWLQEHRDAVGTPAPVLVHGDFRVGNLIFDGDGTIRAVVDWERAMTGHPYHDVGYLCLPGMRIGGRICGVFSERELSDAWSDRLGEPFERHVCAYFRIMSMFTELCTMLRAQLRGPLAGALRQSRSLPLIVTIQRDLLEAMVRWNRGEPAL